jgi:glycosyltransferase involved in cell wall biosynthesis
MASQRAVVATNCNGIPNLLNDGDNGLIVPTADPDALFHAIRRCIFSNDLAAQLARQGRRTIEDRFSFDRRMQRIVDVYRKLSPELAAKIARTARIPDPVKQEDELIGCHI